jgi:hypothetical protein
VHAAKRDLKRCGWTPVKVYVKLYSRVPRATRSIESVSHDDGPAQPRSRVLERDHSEAAARRALIRLLRSRRRSIAEDWTARHLSIDEIRGFVGHVTSGKGETDFSRDAYLMPLLALLRGALGGAGSAWRAVYLDERTRFLVPAEVRIAARQTALGPVLASDVLDLLERLPPRHRKAAASILGDLHAGLDAANPAPVRLLLIGDCVMTELRAFVTGRCREAGIDVEIRHQYLSFDRGVSLGMAAVIEHVQAGAVDLVALSFFNIRGSPALSSPAR